MKLSDCYNFNDFRKLAKKNLPSPIFHYIDGGADDEKTLKRNTDSFDDCDLIPNILASVGKPDLSTTLFGKKIPAGGGFYLRTLPLFLIKNAIKNYNFNDIPATFYVHSWELTPEFMPKIPLSFKDNFITYYNIKKTYNKLDNILNNFKFTSFENFLSHK